MHLAKALAVFLASAPLTILAAPTISLSSAALFTDYVGSLVHSINNVTPGATVKVERIADLNSNGQVDAGEPIRQSFSVTDGSRPTIAGHVITTVPGDDDAAVNGSIRIDLPFSGIDSVFGRQPGSHIVRVTDSSGQATARLFIEQPQRAEWIGGRVAGHFSDTVPFATVLVFKDGVIQRSVRSDAIGNYLFFCEPGQYVLVPFGPDRVGGPASFTIAPNGGINSSLLLAAPSPVTPFRTVSGRIADAQTGAPLPFALVYAQHEGQYFSASQTDAQGNYSFSFVNAGTVNVLPASLAIQGYVGKTQPQQLPYSLENAVVNLSFAKADAVIHGRVTTTQNAPVANLLLRATSDGTPRQETLGRTMADGSYTLAVTQGRWTVETVDPSSVRVHRGSATVDVQTASATRADLSLQAVTAFVRGQIREGGGGYYANSAVRAYFENSPTPTVVATTDGTANYILPVWAGSWRMRIGRPGHLERDILFQVTDGVDQIINDNLPYYSQQIGGRILDGFGVPVSGIAIRAETTINGVAYEVNTPSAGEGYYVMYVPDGTYRFTLNCDELEQRGFRCPEPVTRSFAWPNGTAPAFTLFPLPRTELRGVVVNQSGAGLADVRLEARDSVSDVAIETTSGADGAFTFDLPGAGNWFLRSLTARPGEISPTLSFSVAQGQTIGDISFRFLSMDGAVSGSIRSPADAGLGPVDLTISNGGYTFVSQASSDGTFAFAAPRTVGWRIQADCNDLLPLGFACVSDQTADVTSGTARVDFIAQPLPPVAQAPVLRLARLIRDPANPLIEFTVEGESRVYDIVASPGIPFTAAATVGSVTIPANQSSVTTRIPITPPYRYFRVQSRP